MPDNTQRGFDIERLRTLILARVDGIATTAEVGFDVPGLSLLVVPINPANDPIHIRAVADECHIRFGAGTRQPLGWGHVGDEDHVLDIVDAIITGNATERAHLDEDGQVRLFAHIRGAESAMLGGGDLRVVSVRDLPAW